MSAPPHTEPEIQEDEEAEERGTDEEEDANEDDWDTEEDEDEDEDDYEYIDHTHDIDGEYDDNEDEGEYVGQYIPSVADLRSVRSMFSYILPAELIEVIIDEAEFWPCEQSDHDYGHPPYRSTASPTSAVPYDEHACAALTSEMSKLIKHKGFKVKKVKFIIRGHDQGWGGRDNGQGEYAGAWTWFEAKIVRPLDPPRIDKYDIMRDPEIMWDVQKGTTEWCRTVKNPYANAKSSIKSKDEYVVAGRGDSWTIQRNRRANEIFKKHTVDWDLDEPFDAPDEIRRLDYEGKGQGAGFVKNLGKDDRIAVMARARFPGWVNSVRSVTIVVFYSV